MPFNGITMSVSKRMAIGFTFLIIMLLLMGIGSFQAITGIGLLLNQVTKSTTPALVKTSDLNVKLLSFNGMLERSVSVDAFDPLLEIEKEVSQLREQYIQLRQALNLLLISGSEVSQHLVSADQAVQAYFSVGLNWLEQRSLMLDLQQKRAKQLKLIQADLNALEGELLLIQQDTPNSAAAASVAFFRSQAGLLSARLTALISVSNTKDNESSSDKAKRFMISEITTAVQWSVEKVGTLTEIETGRDNSTEETAGYADVSELQYIIKQLKDTVIGQQGFLAHHKSVLTAEQDYLELGTQVSGALSKAQEQLSVFSGIMQSDAKSVDIEAMRYLDFWTQLIPVICVLAVICGLCIALWISRSIQRGLKELHRVLQKVKTGDLSHRVQVDSGDEFSTLGDGINELVERLCELIGEIASSSKQLSGTADTLASGAGKTVMEIDAQRELTLAIDSAVTELAASAKGIAGNMQTSLQDITGIHTNAEENQKALGQTIVDLQQLNEESKHSARVIGQLHSECVNISNILQEIEQIAEQTNLLALNAAIEAARAGEHGRGFAVVADEVRALAARTQNSTQQIQTLIETLLNSSTEAVNAIERSNLQVMTCSDSAAQVETALCQMVEVLEKEQLGRQDVSNTVKHQQNISQQVLDQLTDILNKASVIVQEADVSRRDSQALTLLVSDQQKMIQQFRLAPAKC